MEYTFWICALLVIYTYVGYGLLLFCMVKIKRFFAGNKSKKEYKDEEIPHLTLMICAYNEEDIVEEKMANCHKLNYPKDRLHIVWVTDGSNDNTNAKLAEYNDVTVIYSPERKGKTAALNHGMSEINTPIVAFTDANTMLATDSLLIMARIFADDKVGCVSGEKRVAAHDAGDMAGQNEGLYWKYESTLKRWDCELYSTMGAAGELFAIRAELFEPMPEDTLLDDFILSMRMVMKGYKIAYSADAYALEYGSASIAEEQKRKRRIAAGGLQSIWRLKKLLLPYPRPIATFQYVSHRVLRWSITPIALFALIPINVWLVMTNPSPVYRYTWYCQILFYVLAIIGAYGKGGIAKTIFYFLFMNINVFRGMAYLLKNKTGGAWEKARRSR